MEYEYTNEILSSDMNGLFSEEEIRNSLSTGSVAEYATLDAMLKICIVLGIVLFIGLIIGIIANWRIFKKAGQPGWASIVPFYNSYINYKIFWGKGWLFLIPILLSTLCYVPVVCYFAVIALLIVYGLTTYKKSEAFGHGVGFAIALFLFPWIFNLILAFGKSEYLGVPQDGFSFDQLNEKYGRKTEVTFIKPEETQKPDISYIKPDDKPEDTEDSDIEYLDM